MNHPKNRLERKRLASKKEKSEDFKSRGAFRRLAKENLEQKEALDVLRRKVPTSEDEDT